MRFGRRKAIIHTTMKVLICLSLFAVTTYATYVGYPYVYQASLLQNGFYPSGYGFSSLGSPAVTVVKPFYPGFYDYRLGLSPSFYPGLYPTGGVLQGAPTIIHLIPSPPDEDGDKKKKKKGKGKDGKDGKDEETTTMASEEIEKAEKKDEEGDDDKNDSIEVESV